MNLIVLLSFCYFFFLLFIVLQGIDALSFYKGLKYTVVNVVNLYRFTKDQPFI